MSGDSGLEKNLPFEEKKLRWSSAHGVRKISL